MTSEPQWPCNITSSLALPPPFFNIYTLVHPSICLCTAATPRNTPFPPPYSHTLSLLLPDNRHTDQTPSYCKQHHCWECSFCCCPRPPPPRNCIFVCVRESRLSLKPLPDATFEQNRVEVITLYPWLQHRCGEKKKRTKVTQLFRSLFVCLCVR